MIDPREEEWEVCDDDGFVYKRRKRQRTENLLQPTRSAVVDEPTEAELKRRRLLRKKRTLLKLRREYREEIRQWEELSDKLKQMKVDRPRFASPQSSSPLPAVEVVMDTGSERRLVDELLMQVEAQEEIIKNVSDLCDVARQLCQNREEQLKQSLFDLPVWASPTALMGSLSEVANMEEFQMEGDQLQGTANQCPFLQGSQLRAS